MYSSSNASSDAFSVSSSTELKRESMLERQRQVALRRRQNQIHSGSILRAHHTVQNNLVSVESSTTRVQLMNQPSLFEQNHTIRRVSAPCQFNQTFNGEASPLFNVGHDSSQPIVSCTPIRELSHQHQMMMMNSHCYDSNSGRFSLGVPMNHSSMSKQYQYQNVYDPLIQLTNHQSVMTSEDASSVSELTDTKLCSIEKSHNMSRRSPPRTVSLDLHDQKQMTSTSSLIEKDEVKLQSSNESAKYERGKQEGSHVNQDKKCDTNCILSDKMAINTPLSDICNVVSAASEPERNKGYDQKMIAFITDLNSIEDLNVDDPVIMRSFLMRPCPKGLGMVHCYIRRNKGIKNTFFPEYRMYFKSNNAFLMTSKKRTGNRTSNYLISMSRNDHDSRMSPSILGKVRSNFLGTEYVIYDGGKNPLFEDSASDDAPDQAVRCEMGAILYEPTTSLGSKGTRKMKACVGKVDSNGNPLKIWQPISIKDDRMVSCFREKEPSQIDKLLCLVSKPPTWNEDAKTFVLDFNGQKTLASVKNFQLVEESNQEKILLQFGRVGNDDFELLVQWPLSLFQAFALTLSSFDSKLGCD